MRLSAGSLVLADPGFGRGGGRDNAGPEFTKQATLWNVETLF